MVLDDAPRGRGLLAISSTLVLSMLMACGSQPAPAPNARGATPLMPAATARATPVMQPTAKPGPDEPAPAPPAPSEPGPTPDRAPEAPAMVTGSCIAADPVALGQSEARRVNARLAFGANGGLVAFTQDETHVSVRRLDANGQVQPGESVVELTNAMDLFGLYRLASRYLVLSHGLCPSGRRMNKCLVLRALSPDGSPAGAEHIETTREWMTGPQLRVDGDSLVVLRGHLYIPSVLERYRVAADGSITRESLAQLDANAEGAEQSVALGLTVGAGRWAAIVRDYDSRRERYVMRLYRSEGEPVVLGLRSEEQQQMLDLSYVNDGLRFVLGATVGPSRPRIALLGPDGQVSARLRALSSEEPLTGNRVVPSVQSVRRRLSFARHDLAGRAVGEPLPLTQGDDGDVDGAGALYAAASVLRTRRQPSTISLQTVRCQAR